MSVTKYSNFVRSSSLNQVRYYPLHPNLNGEEAKKLYLEEVKEIGDPEPVTRDDEHLSVPRPCSASLRKKQQLARDIETRELTDKDLFLTVQNDDVDTLKLILDRTPDKINILDDYGWSLLMIACQSNSVEAVKILLNRNVNTSVRDKAGNSAQNLVIKNRNLVLADLLLTHREHNKVNKTVKQDQEQKQKVKLKEFTCDICNKTYADKQEHLSSTVHNINASKGRRIPATFVIPPSNKGYQLMLKEGWDRESGLGPDGSGKRYPIKTVQKKDRKGLGLDKKKAKPTEIEILQKQTKKAREREHRYEKRLEAKFRREFY